MSTGDLTVVCPTCAAAVGQTCAKPLDGARAVPTHHDRLALTRGIDPSTVPDPARSFA